MKKGEIFGLYGLVGAGRTELLETIFGIRTRAAGRVYYKDKLMNFSSSKDAMDHGFALITEERKADGLFIKADITFNTTIANMNQYKTGIALSHDEMVRATAEEIRVMHTKCMGPDDMIANLSGGNQQKVIIAREVTNDKELLIAVNPTRGLDVGAIEFVHKYLVEQRNKNRAVLLVSFELDEIMSLSDRIEVIFDGQITGSVAGKDADEKELGFMMAGGKTNE